jgi:HPr kinase/phosphorylase
VTVVNIHASCVVIGAAGAAFGAPADAGVLLLGESGTGKSEVALRLIAMGAQLVADDQCELFFDGAALRTRARRNIAGLMEVRGVGIVALPFVRECRVALVVRATGTMAERLPLHRRYEPPPHLSVPVNLCPPEILLDTGAASAPAKILAAVAAFEKHLFREDIPMGGPK